ncbi:hypothetical protein [Streptomyces coeruleorubidus]|uniref:hypothetical protein n=1 Tax=Streptomyces coeruleorubidus TaxID=116188 RepID=UPI0033B3F75C
MRGRHDGDRAIGRNTGTPAGRCWELHGAHHCAAGRAERSPGRDLTTRLRAAAVETL